MIQITATRIGWLAPLKDILIAVVFFLLGGSSDFWLRQHPARSSVARMHDAPIGSCTGILLLLYERRQRQSIVRTLEVIRLINHHVRNSLQVIWFAASDPEREELATELRNAVERIEGVLREFLPGQRDNIENLLFPSTTQSLAVY